MAISPKVKCMVCKDQEMYDISQGKGDKRNYICWACDAHYFNGAWYPKDMWNSWMSCDCEFSCDVCDELKKGVSTHNMKGV